MEIRVPLIVRNGSRVEIRCAIRSCHKLLGEQAPGSLVASGWYQWHCKRCGIVYRVDPETETRAVA